MEPVLMLLIGLLIMSLIAIIDLYYVSEQRAKREIKELKDRLRFEAACRGSALNKRAELDARFNLTFRKGKRIV